MGNCIGSEKPDDQVKFVINTDVVSPTNATCSADVPGQINENYQFIWKPLGTHSELLIGGDGETPKNINTNNRDDSLDDKPKYFTPLSVEEKNGLFIFHTMHDRETWDLEVPFSDFRINSYLMRTVKNLELVKANKYEDVCISSGEKLRDKLVYLMAFFDSVTPESNKITRIKPEKQVIDEKEVTVDLKIPHCESFSHAAKGGSENLICPIDTPVESLTADNNLHVHGIVNPQIFVTFNENFLPHQQCGIFSPKSTASE